MVVGEDFVIGKGIEALISWFNVKKEEKAKVKGILLALKIGLNNIILHMNLCKRFGHIMHKDLQVYMPSDIEQLNNVLIQYQSVLTNELYDEMMKFINFLVKFNEEINSLTMGKNMKEYDEKIINSINEFTSKIDELTEKI